MQPGRDYTRRFRIALSNAGYSGHWQTHLGITVPLSFFNSARKDGTRRLKLWFGEEVWQSTRKQQQKLERELKKQFGRQYVTGYFVKGAYWRKPEPRSLCIVLDETQPY